MFRLVFLLLPCLLFYHLAHATIFTWTGVTDNNWNTPTNWTPNGPPGSGDTAVFSQGSPLNFPGSGGPEYINFLQFNGVSSTITGISLTVSNAITSSGGTNSFVGASVTAGATITTSAGTTTFGSLALGPGITISGSGITEFAGPLNGGGNPVFISSGNLLVSSLSALGGSSISGLSMTNSTLIIGINNFMINSSPPTITLNATETFNTNNFNATIANITGPGSLTKAGAGTLTLSGTNTYSGDTTVSSGTLQAGSTTALSSNSIVTLASGTTLSLGTFSNTIGSLSGTGSLDLGTATLTINNGANQTFNGVISGTGSLTLNAGTFSLRGTNTYSGSTTIAGGFLNIVSDSNLGTSTLMINNGGTLQAGNSFTSSRNVTLSGGFGNIDTNGFDLTMSGVIGSTGGLNKIGLGTLFLTNSNTYSGGTIITGGTLNISQSSSLGTGALIINNDSTLQAGANGITLSKPITLNGTANIDTNNFSLTLAGIIGGSGQLKKINGGTLILSGSNNYSGGTTVNAGTLSIFSESNLGSGPLTMLGGTTLAAAGPFILNGSRSVFLGSGVISMDSNGNNIEIDGSISGPGLLLKTDVGTLTLMGSNSYSGGTTIGGGTLNITSDSNLGATSGTLTIDGGTTLQAGGSFFLSPDRKVFLSGDVATIDILAFNPTIAGPILGPGLLEKIGSGSLTLLGMNTYTGGTHVVAGTLQGNTSSLQGNIDVAAAAILAFNQSTSGTYSGVFSGAGSLKILGGGSVTLSGSSPSFTGTTTVTGNSTLVMNGSLASSPTTVDAGSVISGTGTIGLLTDAGQIIPGSGGAGTLTVNGDVSFVNGSLITQLSTNSNGLLTVTGATNLATATSVIQLTPGFFGVSGVRTILTAGFVNGTFANLVLDPRIEGFLVYNPNNVQLVFQVLNPFLNFPFANANERAVGNNLDALITGKFASSELINLIDSFGDLSINDINQALNQLHPASLSAYAELHAELGGQLLSLFHRRPTFCCNCYDSFRLWVEPFGNWIHEKHQGMQIGFHATTRGIAVGTDYQFLDSWTIGLGGAYSLTDLKWSEYGGYGYVESGYGAFYSDFSIGNFFLGFSGYAGKDRYDNIRKIRFSSIDLQAKSHFHGLEMGAQLTSAYYFGTRSFQLFPYATADFLYLKNSAFSENGAGAINLGVNPYRSSDLRAETGLSFSFVDRNDDETICVAPMISMGYVLELPLHRDHFRARFTGTPIPFKTTGWDMAWQLLNLKMGLDITYRCFTLSSCYGADISPEGDSPLFNQRANFNMSFSF